MDYSLKYVFLRFFINIDFKFMKAERKKMMIAAGIS
jgi:hypothetical protein